MNVFVLSTGRCGSQTFAKACRSITNYTAGHETQNPWLYPRTDHPYRQLAYPENHIEVDNRLSWLLGLLDEAYGAGAYYVHLKRDHREVSRSLVRRGKSSILFAFAWGVLQYYEAARDLPEEEWFNVGLQYCATVDANIELFLRDKPRKIQVQLEQPRGSFKRFWSDIGAQGDLEAAMSQWDVRHNASRC